MKLARGVERLSIPSTIAGAQPHPRESRHQIEFGRKGVAQPHWIQMSTALAHLNMRGPYRLGVWIVLRDLELNVVGFHVERTNALPAIEPTRVGHERFDQEHTVAGKMPRGALEASNLFILGRAKKVLKTT